MLTNFLKTVTDIVVGSLGLPFLGAGVAAKMAS